MRQRHEEGKLRSASKSFVFFSGNWEKSMHCGKALMRMRPLQCSFLLLACIVLEASTEPSHLQPLRCVGLLCGSVTQAGAGSGIAAGPRALLSLRGGGDDADAEKPAFTLDGYVSIRVLKCARVYVYT